jgi:hypothetical protein
MMMMMMIIPSSLGRLLVILVSGFPRKISCPGVVCHCLPLAYVFVSIYCKTHFHNQPKRDLSWSVISRRNMEQNGNYSCWKDIKSKSYY